jgi:hypothetical protein
MPRAKPVLHLTESRDITLQSGSISTGPRLLVTMTCRTPVPMLKSK